jgi:hypothetical protein
MYLSHSHRSAPQHKDIVLDPIKLGVNAFQKNNEGQSFYFQFTMTNPDSDFQIASHINDLREMDKVHWRLSGWLTIHFAITKGDLSLVKTLLEKGSRLSKQTGDPEFNVAGRQFFRGMLRLCMAGKTSSNTSLEHQNCQLIVEMDMQALLCIWLPLMDQMTVLNSFFQRGPMRKYKTNVGTMHFILRRTRKLFLL